MVFISNGKPHVSAYSGHYQLLKNFLGIRVIHNMHKPRIDVKILSLFIIIYNFFIIDNDEISTLTPGLCILYTTLLARKLSNPDYDPYRPKHVVFHCQ